jgi:hypothetical protein
MRLANAAGRLAPQVDLNPFAGLERDQAVRFVKFIVAEIVAEIDSEETSIGARETRDLTAREFAVLLLAMLRGN